MSDFLLTAAAIVELNEHQQQYQPDCTDIITPADSIHESTIAINKYHRSELPSPPHPTIHHAVSDSCMRPVLGPDKRTGAGHEFKAYLDQVFSNQPPVPPPSSPSVAREDAPVPDQKELVADMDRGRRRSGSNTHRRPSPYDYAFMRNRQHPRHPQRYTSPPPSDNKCSWRTDTETTKDSIGDSCTRPEGYGKCGHVCSDAGDLLRHIVDDHVGRKSKKRVTLECRWPGCDYSAKTRDHIVSHVKRHVPHFRPFSCSLCGRAFVRKPDLNKHLKIHSGRAFVVENGVLLDDTATQSNPAISPPLLRRFGSMMDAATTSNTSSLGSSSSSSSSSLSSSSPQIYYNSPPLTSTSTNSTTMDSLVVSRSPPIQPEQQQQHSIVLGSPIFRLHGSSNLKSVYTSNNTAPPYTLAADASLAPQQQSSPQRLPPSGQRMQLKLPDRLFYHQEKHYSQLKHPEIETPLIQAMHDGNYQTSLKQPEQIPSSTTALPQLNHQQQPKQLPLEQNRSNLSINDLIN